MLLDKDHSQDRERRLGMKGDSLELKRTTGNRTRKTNVRLKRKSVKMNKTSVIKRARVRRRKAIDRFVMTDFHNTVFLNSGAPVE